MYELCRPNFESKPKRRSPTSCSESCTDRFFQCVLPSLICTLLLNELLYTSLGVRYGCEPGDHLCGINGFFCNTAFANCPLDLRMSNFTPLSSACSVFDKGKCCRYINSFVAVSIARYAKTTGNLGISSNLSTICVQKISDTIERYGVPPTAKSFCGLGTKIPVSFECQGRATINGMLDFLNVTNVIKNCQDPLLELTNCNKCINASISYIRNFTREDNVTLNMCRDATFAAFASQSDDLFSVANCFFGVQWLVPLVLQTPLPTPKPQTNAPSRPPLLHSFAPNASSINPSRNHKAFHLTLISSIGIAVSAISLVMLAILIYFIRKKNRELGDSLKIITTSSKASNFNQPVIKIQEGQYTFRNFSYRETKKATENFKTVIGEGGFGTVYKAEFNDGFVAAVKRMNKSSEQHEDEFCKEIQLLARLHHRHLVSLRGFCVMKHERFLIYEYMKNGSLKDNLHSPDRKPLSWQTRIQIAINVANALEYLHFYCDPPLCHRDIKSSNILLDENFIAKLADFGLAHASRIGSICFEPVNTDIQGTPGYMDPEYVITQELTEKSDVYSYGVLLLEIISGRHAIEEKENLVEWCEKLIRSESESRLSEVVDPRIRDSYDLNQLETVVAIVRWCTQRERWARPSIQEVIGLLQECSNTKGLVEEDGGSGEWRGRRRGGKMHGSEENFQSWDASSTSRSYCSRNFFIENESPPF